MLLLREGKITRRSLQQSLQKMTTTSRLQGQLLCEMGVMTPLQLEEALRRQLLGRVMRLIALDLDHARFDLAAMRSRDLCFTSTIRVHPYLAILEHIRQLSRDQVRDRLEAWGRTAVRLEPAPAHRRALDDAIALLEPQERRVALQLTSPFVLADLADRADPVPRLVLFLAATGVLRRSPRRARARDLARDCPRAPAPLRQAARLLGVPQGADRDRLRTAFRRRVMEVHPDRHPGADEETRQHLAGRFRAIQRAYDLLYSATDP
jgi:hypothetical protein